MNNIFKKLHHALLRIKKILIRIGNSSMQKIKKNFLRLILFIKKFFRTEIIYLYAFQILKKFAIKKVHKA